MKSIRHAARTRRRLRTRGSLSTAVRVPQRSADRCACLVMPVGSETVERIVPRSSAALSSVAGSVRRQDDESKECNDPRFSVATEQTDGGRLEDSSGTRRRHGSTETACLGKKQKNEFRSASVLSAAADWSAFCYPRYSRDRLHKRSVHSHHGTPVPTSQPPSASSPEPILLLEGDTYHVSTDGLAKTVYTLADAIEDDLPPSSIGVDINDASFLPSFCLEEMYHLGRSTKQFHLYSSGPESTSGHSDRRRSFRSCSAHAPVGASASTHATPEPLYSVRLQELTGSAAAEDTAEEGSAHLSASKSSLTGSTGCMTWESSLAMALYFAERPYLLQDRNVVELGSGVGLGGILVHNIMSHTKHSQHGQEFASKTQCKNRCNGGEDGHDGYTASSLTLTDYSPEVLQQCKLNVSQNSTASPDHGNNLLESPTSISVCELDWYDLAGTNNGDVDHVSRPGGVGDAHRHGYDVVLACDCAYRPQDVPVLIDASLNLLKRTDRKDVPHSPTIHMFGPVNRGCYQEVHRQLRSNPAVHVDAEELTLRRRRVPMTTSSNERPEFPFRSATPRSVIVHLIVRLNAGGSDEDDSVEPKERKEPTTMQDID